jgi:hypothetical protein
MVVSRRRSLSQARKLANEARHRGAHAVVKRFRRTAAWTLSAYGRQDW